MPIETTIEARGDACAEAVRRFAAEVSRETNVRLNVQDASRDVELEFAGEADRICLRVEGSVAPSFEDEAGDDWEHVDHDETSTGGDGPGELARHYLRTLRALARNHDASRAVLKTLSGRGPAPAPAATTTGNPKRRKRECRTRKQREGR